MSKTPIQPNRLFHLIDYLIGTRLALIENTSVRSLEENFASRKYYNHRIFIPRSFSHPHPAWRFPLIDTIDITPTAESIGFFTKGQKKRPMAQKTPSVSKVYKRKKGSNSNWNHYPLF